MSISNDRWETHRVGGHACDVFRPSRTSDHGYIVLYLHGLHADSLHRKESYTEKFDEHGLIVVAPQCGPTWWTDRVHPAFDAEVSPQNFLLDHVMPFVSDQFDGRTPQVALLGTGMGGQGVLGMAYRFPAVFPVVAAISPAIDFQQRIDEGDQILLAMYGDRESARQATAILYLHPLNWPRHQFFCCDPADERWFDSADRLRMKLSSLGVPFVCDLETTVGGHGLPYCSAMAGKAVDFLVRGLEQERLRVV